MLHPDQFKVNEAWIAFKLNDEPIHTQTDGDFNFLALIDAASCFLLCFVPLPLRQVEPTRSESRQFLENAYVHKHRWPKKLIIDTGQPATFLAAEAELLGIEVLRVPADQFRPIVGEAQSTFRVQFGDGRDRR